MRATTIIAAAAILLLVFCNHAIAQQISGSITCSHSGRPLAGASVMFKGTIGETGTITDIAGNYRLAADSSHTVLVFSSIGYKPREVKIGNDTIVNVTLTEEDIRLNELQIIADVFFETKITSKIDTVRVKKFGIRKFKISVKRIADI